MIFSTQGEEIGLVVCCLDRATIQIQGNRSRISRGDDFRDRQHTAIQMECIVRGRGTNILQVEISRSANRCRIVTEIRNIATIHAKCMSPCSILSAHLDRRIGIQVQVTRTDYNFSNRSIVTSHLQPLGRRCADVECTTVDVETSHIARTCEAEDHITRRGKCATVHIHRAIDLRGTVIPARQSQGTHHGIALGDRNRARTSSKGSVGIRGTHAHFTVRMIELSRRTIDINFANTTLETNV